MPFVDCGPGGQAERGRFRKAACGPPPQCERVLPDPLTQADSVPACAGPSCQRKGFQDKGAWYVGLCFIRLPSSEKAALNVGTGPFVPIMKLCSTLHAASVCEGKPCINASGPRPGRRVKGKDCRIRGRGTSASALFGSRLRKKYVSNAGCFLFGQNTRASTPERTFNCKG